MNRELLDWLTGAPVVDLAEPLSAATPHSPTHPPLTISLLRRHGDAVRPDGSSSAFEAMHMGTHTGTHLDAFSHYSSHGTMLGDVAVPDAMGAGGFTQLGVDTVAPLLCRGVLLDMPALAGVTALDPGQAVTAGDLRRACDRQGVSVERGDAVLIRTGRPTGAFADINDPGFLARGVPGPDVSAARWLAERGVRASGCDTLAYEWIEPGLGLSRLDVHDVFLRRVGVHIIELLNLEDLAGRGVYEFVFVALPLRLVGATGSPVRPVAVLA